MKILTINTGSSSLKFRVVEVPSHQTDGISLHPLAYGHIDPLGKDAHCKLTVNGKTTVNEYRLVADHAKAVREALSWLKAERCEFDAVGHRIVHGGERFTQPALINREVIEAIKGLEELAPIHNPIGLAGILTCRDLVGADVPMIAVFDTAFHSTLPRHASTYAIPHDLASRYKIRRYGFHGTAHSYLAMRYSEMTGVPQQRTRLITLQLGHGCSAAAIRHGCSIDTSMGFTPLEGLVMGTRSGDVDPAIVAYLAQKESVEAAQVVDLLNSKSGLLGLSGKTGNMKELLSLREHDDQARLALEVYCYRIRKCIGSYMAVLSGADAVIFSGGVGEHAAEIRAHVCRDMEWCGLKLDPDRNTAVKGVEARISADDASCHVYVIPVDEESVIATETYHYLQREGIKHG